jgi:hypothetical protein
VRRVARAQPVPAHPRPELNARRQAVERGDSGVSQ